jgi:alpha-maltose-1-phosphate synthase
LRAPEPRGSAAGAGPAPRVLLVCDHFVKQVAPLAREIAAHGSPTVLLTRDHEFEFGGVAGAMRRHLDALLGDEVRHVALEGRVRDPRAIRSLGHVGRLVAGFEPDVVHFQESVVDDVRLLAATRPRPGRYAVTVHDPSTHPGDRVRARWKRRVWLELVRRAGLVFVHAQALADELRAESGTRAPIEVIPLGIDAPLHSPLPEQPRLLFFGRISEYKGIDTLLDAMPTLWERLPDARLVVAGKGRGLPEHRLWDDDRVTLRFEHVDEEEVPGLFRDASCVVLPYRQASQSNVGSQAKQYGRPLVVTELGGLPELVADGSGMVVAPEDPPALAGALERVLTDRGAAEAMGRAGIASVQRESGWPHVAAMTLEAYDRHLVPGLPRRSTRLQTA